MLQEKKKISVVMCTYNGGKYLKEQLDSIVNQTYPVYEIIIQDDGSTDDTMIILKEYQAHYPFIHVSQNETNNGLNLNFSSAFYKASGDYIAIADQDDIWLNTKIQQLTDGMGINYLVYSNSWIFINREDLNISLDKQPVVKRLPFSFITLQDGVYGHSAMFRKELLDHIPGMMWKQYPYDYCLSLVSMGLHRIAGLDKYLTYWRRHPEASSGMPQQSKKRLAGYLEGFLCTCNKEIRDEVHRFYISILPFYREESIYKRFVVLMAGNNPFRILQACIMTYRNRDKLVTTINPESFLGRFRAFCVPLFIHKNWKQVHATLFTLS